MVIEELTILTSVKQYPLICILLLLLLIKRFKDKSKIILLDNSYLLFDILYNMCYIHVDMIHLGWLLILLSILSSYKLPLLK